MKTKVSIWTETLEDAEQIWRRLFMNENWDIEQEVKYKWNWSSFKFMYNFKLSKPAEWNKDKSACMQIV